MRNIYKLLPVVHSLEINNRQLTHMLGRTTQILIVVANFIPLPQSKHVPDSVTFAGAPHSLKYFWERS